jgi:hypothetical protein
VMSLKTIPFFGKSGTSRTAARNLEIVSGAIARRCYSPSWFGQLRLVAKRNSRS